MRPLPQTKALVVLRTQVCHEIIIEPVDEVAAVRVLLVAEQAGDAKAVTRASDDLPIEVIGFQPEWPGVGDRSPPRWKLVVMVRSVHRSRHQHLAVIVDAADLVRLGLGTR